MGARNPLGVKPEIVRPRYIERQRVVRSARSPDEDRAPPVGTEAPRPERFGGAISLRRPRRGRNGEPLLRRFALERFELGRGRRVPQIAFEALQEGELLAHRLDARLELLPGALRLAGPAEEPLRVPRKREAGVDLDLDVAPFPVEQVRDGNRFSLSGLPGPREAGEEELTPAAKGLRVFEGRPIGLDLPLQPAGAFELFPKGAFEPSAERGKLPGPGLETNRLGHGAREARVLAALELPFARELEGGQQRTP